MSAESIVCVIDEPALLGESPMWHPDEQVLYYCDIPGYELRRFEPVSKTLERWRFDTDVSCCAPVVGGGLLLALRSGFWFFDPASGEKRLIAAAPYDTSVQRFNDGKCDAAGRLWCGSMYEPRTSSLAALYCLENGAVTRKADGITLSNGLGWSPDGRTMYWADTVPHTIYAFQFDPNSGELSNRRVFAQFTPRKPDAALDGYGGRPDGAAVDVEGNVWVAMYEGQRLVQLAPDGSLRREVRLPVRCPTMPCFGGPDLKTMYITTSRNSRPAAELQEQPLAGAVFAMRVEVAGLPTNFARLDGG